MAEYAMILGANFTSLSVKAAGWVGEYQEAVYAAGGLLVILVVYMTFAKR